MRNYRVGLLTSHPIQCQAPLFQALARRPEIDLTVFFGSDHGVERTLDPQFGVAFAWDVPLLEGYRHQFLRNVARRPDVNRYRGVDTPEIAAWIRRERFDAFIVMGWYLKSCWQAIRACWATGTPLVMRGIAYRDMPPRGWPVRLVKRWTLKRLFRRTDAFLTIGQRNEEFYAHYGADPARFVRAPHAVDNARFAQAAAQWRVQRQELRRGWDLPAEGCVFLFSGKLIPKKRPLDAIAAVGRLPEGLSTALLIVGDGPLRAACEEAARPLAPGRVRFAGFLNQSEMPRAYAVADCLVMPSDVGETWGLAVNEAMACGLPVIVSDRVGCAPDLVIDGQSGIVVRRGDLDELTLAMLAMASDPRARRRLARQAVRHISGFDIAAAAEGVVRAVEQVCAGRAAGQPVPSADPPPQPKTTRRHRVWRYFREVCWCLKTGARWRDAWRLAYWTLRFHRQQGRGGPLSDDQRARRIHVHLRLAGQVHRLAFRPFAGDLAVLYQVLMDGYYDFDLSRLGRPRTIVDLGANVGFSALYLAAKLQPDVLVCVEAAPDNAELLRHNLAGLADRCLVIEAAVTGEVREMAQITMDGPAWSRSILPRTGRLRPVKALRIEDVLAHCPGGRADLVKINIEGGERPLIEAGAAWLDRAGLILIELHEPYGRRAFAEDMRRYGWLVYEPGQGPGNHATLALPAHVQAA